MNKPSLWLAALLFLFAACQGYVHGGERAKYYTMVEGQVKDSAFVKFLRDREVKLKSDGNGLLQIYVHGSPETIPAVVKFIGLMKTRMEVAMENLANSNTTWDAKRKTDPYRRKIFSIDKDGNASVVEDETPPILRYIPGHPHADEKGYVSFPNINAATEIVELNVIQREYYLAERLLEKCLPDNYIPDYSIQMIRWNTEYFREIAQYRNRLD